MAVLWGTMCFLIYRQSCFGEGWGLCSWSLSAFFFGPSTDLLPCLLSSKLDFGGLSRTRERTCTWLPIEMARYIFQRKRYFFVKNGVCSALNYLHKGFSHWTSTVKKYGLKTPLLLFNIHEIEKKVFEVIPSLIKLILLHTIVALHYTQHIHVQRLDQRERLSQCSKTNYYKSSSVTFLYKTVA